MVDLDKLLDRVERNWDKPATLACVVLAIPVVWLSGLAVIREYDLGWRDAVLPLIVMFAFAGVWSFCRRCPRTRHGNVGFVVAIKCGTGVDRRKVKEDLIESLRSLVRAGESGRVMQFIEMPQRLCDSILDDDDAMRLRLKSRAHFILYGDVRARESDGKSLYVIRLRGGVMHRSTREQNVKNLQSEFSELLPHAVRISAENDFLSFDVMSHDVHNVARYVIGIAAFITGDLQYSSTLYRELYRELSAGIPTETALKIRRRLPQRLRELSLALGDIAYRGWIRTGEGRKISELKQSIEIVPISDRDEYSIRIMQAAVLFLDGRRCVEAMKLVSLCKDSSDLTWRFSSAFLDAYQGRLKRAVQQYKIIGERGSVPSVAMNVEGFIQRIVAEEPDKGQLLYLAGHLNLLVKGDRVAAATYFEDFLRSSSAAQFPAEAAEAKRLVNELRSEAALEDH